MQNVHSLVYFVNHWVCSQFVLQSYLSTQTCIYCTWRTHYDNWHSHYDNETMCCFQNVLNVDSHIELIKFDRFIFSLNLKCSSCVYQTVLSILHTQIFLRDNKSLTRKLYIYIFYEKKNKSLDSICASIKSKVSPKTIKIIKMSRNYCSQVAATATDSKCRTNLWMNIGIVCEHMRVLRFVQPILQCALIFFGKFVHTARFLYWGAKMIFGHWFWVLKLMWSNRRHRYEQR